MTTLLQCTEVHGGITLVESPPALLTLSDVIYVPFSDPKSQAGLFDHGQKMIVQSWYFRGPRSLAGRGDFSTPYTPETIGKTAPDDCYIYGGWLHEHFGHFLLSSLCRYWSTLHGDHPTLKILVHVGKDFAWWFARPWFAAFMAALGITPDRFVRFEDAVRVRQVLLPAPAFEEESFVHRTFATFCNELGRRILGSEQCVIDNTPVFLSKRSLPDGVQKLDNEDAIADALSRHGVEIICPESLSLRQQVGLWLTRPHIVSFVGSALHTSIFAPPSRAIVVNYGLELRSNFRLIDRANGNDTLYLRPKAGLIEDLGARDGFSSVLHLRDPAAIAEPLLRMLDFRQRAAASRAGEPLERRRDYWRYPAAGQELPDPEERLLNVAVDKPTRQSSRHPWVAQKVPDATSGTLTGTFQFHTDIEADPWWEVDLGRLIRIHAVRLFNRVDNSMERCKHFRIDLRGEVMEWTTLHVQHDLVFGGVDDAPFVWVATKPADGRVLRITLLGRDYLHLDQVEVIGHPLTEESAQQPPARRPVFSRLFRAADGAAGILPAR